MIISWATAIYVWSRRPAPGARQLALMMGMVGWWGIPFLLRAWDPSTSTKLLALKLEYISAASVPSLWLWFALVYTNKEEWLTPKRIALLTIVPCITLLLVGTSEAHNLITDFRHVSINPPNDTYVSWKRGIWGWINTFYQYAVLTVGTVVLLRRLPSLGTLYRSQIIPLFITIGIAWGVNILYHVNVIPPGWPIAPLSFTFFGLGVSWSLYRHRLLDIVPVAQDVLVERMSDAILVLDTQTRIVAVNPAGQHLLERDTGEIIGRPIAQVMPNFGAWLQDNLEHPARRQIVRTTEREARHVYDASVSYLQRQPGQTTGYLCVLRDVTDLETAREQAQAADRAKSEFLSNVSHELRTPLASVKLYLNLLQNGKPERYSTYLSSIDREVERLRVLIEGVLTLSRLDLGQLTPNIRAVDLNAILQTLYQDRHMLFENQGLTLMLQTKPDLPLLNVDPQLMEQVITNLLTNAMNYTPQGGIVNLSSTLTEDDHTAWATIAVQDTGLGISPKEQQHIFERFHRGAASQVTQIPGTGLGLAICQEIVNLHQGHITVESQEGVGSTFTIWLPLG
jgi:PAS domain S-box-containing protein